MDNDDATIGRVLTRRDAVRLLALGGTAAAMGFRPLGFLEGRGASLPLPGCVVKPELTEGPYFVDHQLMRSDIRGDSPGATPRAGMPLSLAFAVASISNRSCQPLAGAVVDVWHCDADGVYSDVDDPMSGSRTTGRKFLRGYQVTDKNGSARFSTIYPGWYEGRTVHIHFKIRTTAPAIITNGPAQSFEFTSQLFFDDALSDRIFAKAPYAGKEKRDRLNHDDDIYRESGGQLLLKAVPEAAGYSAAFDIGLDLSDARVGAPDHDGGRGGPPPGGPPPRGRGRGGPPTGSPS